MSRSDDEIGRQSYDGDTHEPDGTIWDPAGAQMKKKHGKKHANTFAQVFGDGASISERALGTTTNQEELEAINRSIELAQRRF